MNFILWRLSAAVLTAALFAAAEAGAAPIDVYFNNFNGAETHGGGATGGMSGITTHVAVPTGFAALTNPGNPSNVFSNQMLRNLSGGSPVGTAGAATTLTLANLPTHDSVSISMLLAVIDSWDSDNGTAGTTPDELQIKVDGVQVFLGTWSNQTGSHNTAVGTLLGSGSNLGFSASFRDRAYDTTGASQLTAIAHSASTLTIDILATGAGWQGGSDESWGMDNFRVTVDTMAVAVPEPITIALFGFGLGGLGLVRRRR